MCLGLSSTVLSRAWTIMQSSPIANLMTLISGLNNQTRLLNEKLDILIASSVQRSQSAGKRREGSTPGKGWSPPPVCHGVSGLRGPEAGGPKRLGDGRGGPVESRGGGTGGSGARRGTGAPPPSGEGSVEYRRAGARRRDASR